MTKPADGKAKDGKLAEIPIPEIRVVASYESDYRPNYQRSRTYLRSRTFGSPAGDVVEYDLDNEDEDWLEKYNDGQNRLPAEKLEVMIWKLETVCGEANEERMAIHAANATEKGLVISYQEKCAMMAGTEALPKEKAVELLQDLSGRPAILEAVYEYWCDKRRRTGKPCLRRLQPPPAPNDANPFNVFRQREKTNRPQTRRRRENDAVSFDKLRLIRRGMEMAYAIVELQLKREEKKAEKMRCERDAQLLQMKLKHEPRAEIEAIESEFAKRPSAKPLSPEELQWEPNKPTVLPMSQVEIVMRPDGTFGLGGERFAPPAAPGAAAKSGSKKRRREEQMALQMAAKGYDPRGAGGMGPGLQGSAHLSPFGGGGGALTPSARAAARERFLAAMDGRGPPMRPPGPPEPMTPYQPPPEIPDIEMIFAKNPEHAGLRSFALPLGTNRGACRARVARGGRIVFDRKDPITREPFADGDWENDSFSVELDGDENEHTPMASVRA